MGVAGGLIVALLATLKPGTHMVGDGAGADAQRAEISDRVAVAVGQERDQQMLGTDIAGTGTRRIHHGGLHHALGARSEVVGGQIGDSALALYHRLELLGCYAAVAQSGVGNTAVLLTQA